jgi:uncharacterized protein (DUF2147 family)
MIWRGLAVMLVALGTAAPALSQEASILGRWRTPAEGGVVDIQRCGRTLCGRLVDAAPLRRDPDQKDVRNRDATLRDRPLRGLAVLQNITGGPTVWQAGPLYDPNSGQGAARGTLTLVDETRLAVRGCVARLFCRTQTWRRAP